LDQQRGHGNRSHALQEPVEVQQEQQQQTDRDTEARHAP